MNISQRVFCFLLLLPFGVVQAAELGLREIVEFGLKNAPQFQKTRNDLTVSGLNLEVASSKFLPSLDLTTVQGYQDGDPTTKTNPWAGDLTLSLTETLYDNGTNYVGHSIAKLENRKAKIQFEKDRDEFCLNIIRAFNSYSLSGQVALVQKFQHDLLLKQFKSIERKYRGGEKTRVEYLRFKARLQRANLSLKAAANNKKKFAEDLKALIGWSRDIFQVKLETPGKQSFSSKSLTTPLLDNHYDYRIAELTKTVNDESVSLVKRKHYPELYLSGNVIYNNSDYLSGGDTFDRNGQTDWSALLTLKYNLWDWGIRRRELAVAKISRDSLGYSIDSTLLTLKAKISKLMLDISQLTENYKLNKELVELEKKSFNSLQKDYRRGRTTFLDLVNAVDNYTTAQESFYRNYFDLSSSTAEHNFHQGKLYEVIIKN